MGLLAGPSLSLKLGGVQPQGEEYSRARPPRTVQFVFLCVVCRLYLCTQRPSLGGPRGEVSVISSTCSLQMTN